LEMIFTGVPVSFDFTFYWDSASDDYTGTDNLLMCSWTLTLD
jgi:hypothetical protein